MEDSMDRFLTINEVAAIANVNRKTIIAWIKDKGLVAFKLGGTRWGVNEKDLRKFIKGGRS